MELIIFETVTYLIERVSNHVQRKLGQRLQKNDIKLQNEIFF